MEIYMIVLIICAIFLIIVVGWIFFGDTIEEHFGDPTSVKQTPDILDLRQQFDDMIVYDNDADGRIGFDKCIEKCNGYCVEFGQTGSAYCFPVTQQKEKDFNGLIVQNDTKLSYPNVD